MISEILEGSVWIMKFRAGFSADASKKKRKKKKVQLNSSSLIKCVGLLLFYGPSNLESTEFLLDDVFN